MTFLLFLSEAMVPLMIFYMVGFGLLSGRPVLDDFIRGARDGMKTVAGIFPTLVGLMVSVGVLRSSGLLDALGELLKAPAALVGLPAPILPAALVRLVSNSAATGLVLDLFKEYGTEYEHLFRFCGNPKDALHSGRRPVGRAGQSGGQRGAVRPDGRRMK